MGPYSTLPELQTEINTTSAAGYCSTVPPFLCEAICSQTLEHRRSPHWLALHEGIKISPGKIIAQSDGSSTVSPSSFTLVSLLAPSIGLPLYPNIYPGVVFGLGFPENGLEIHSHVYTSLSVPQRRIGGQKYGSYHHRASWPNQRGFRFLGRERARGSTNGLPSGSKPAGSLIKDKARPAGY